MTTTAKLFRNGRSQAVRLPREFRFEGDRVRVRRAGRGVLVEPIVVGLCPTDQAGGNLDFPPGSIRSFGDPQSPAVAGHEFVGRVVRANEYSAKKLFKKNIAVGDAVVVDVNIGCGECFECRRGDPPLYCRNGATF